MPSLRLHLYNESYWQNMVWYLQEWYNKMNICKQCFKQNSCSHQCPYYSWCSVFEGYPVTCSGCGAVFKTPQETAVDLGNGKPVSDVCPDCGVTVHFENKENL